MSLQLADSNHYIESIRKVAYSEPSMVLWVELAALCFDWYADPTVRNYYFDTMRRVAYNWVDHVSLPNRLGFGEQYVLSYPFANAQYPYVDKGLAPTVIRPHNTCRSWYYVGETNRFLSNEAPNGIFKDMPLDETSSLFDIIAASLVGDTNGIGILAEVRQYNYTGTTPINKGATSIVDRMEEAIKREFFRAAEQSR